MLELAILGLLKERPMHGYEIRKSLREDFGVLSNLSFGSLYPALARLEASGALSTLEPAMASRRGRRREDALPLTGSLAGERAAITARRSLGEAAAALGARSTRARKVYAITQHGEELFEELLESNDGPAEDQKGFSLRLAFARHLSPQSRLRLLERRRAQLVERLQRSERSLSRPVRQMDDYERSIAEHAKDTIAADLSWVERLLERERYLAERIEAPTSGKARSGRAPRRVPHEAPPVAATSGAGTKQGERHSR
ncbi:MAG: PadR family transcriptional regulator [Acidimicrobiales bacterium]